MATNPGDRHAGQPRAPYLVSISSLRLLASAALERLRVAIPATIRAERRDRYI